MKKLENESAYWKGKSQDFEKKYGPTLDMVNKLSGKLNEVVDDPSKLWNGGFLGRLTGWGGKNWQYGLGALGLAGAGYGLYRMFSGGGGSGGGWGGGAANSSAYYRNRHGYNHPDYEGMMVDNMMARRGGYGY